MAKLTKKLETKYQNTIKLMHELIRVYLKQDRKEIERVFEEIKKVVNEDVDSKE